MKEFVPDSPSPSADRENPIALLRTERTSDVDIFRAPVLAAAAGSTPTASALHRIAEGRPALVVISASIDRLHGDFVRSIFIDDRRRHSVHVLKTGEANKTLDNVAELLSVALDHRLSRDGLFVGIGGGVLLDIVGFAASQFRRGTAHIKIGTTLVAQVDAAVGIKCGVNVGAAKNLAGAFHPPQQVLVDGSFLRTVSDRDMRCGLAEMIKLGVAADAGLFGAIAEHGETLLDAHHRDSETARHLVDLAIRGMVSELATNPYENDLRRRVDLGHTVSPVLEAATGYQLPHGEAVAVDVALSAIISNRMGHLNEQALGSVLALFRTLGIGTWHHLLDDSALIEAALDSAEAHRGGRLRLPLPLALGETVFIDDRTDVPQSLIRESVAQLRKESA